MKRKRFTEHQIFEILKESESGLGTADLCRKYGISKNTFYNWRSKYSGMEVSDLKKMRELEAENTKLKQLLAEQLLDNKAMKAVLSKKW